MRNARLTEPRSKMTLDEAIRILRECGIKSAEEDARLIFSEIGGIARHALVLRDTECDSTQVNEAIARRSSGEPVQHIIGSVGFYRESYEVSRDCLIPREDTELLVDYAVKHIPSGESFIDICTGSGCIAISTLKNTSETHALAIDLSDAALAMAKRNAERNGVSKRLMLSHGDALDFSPTEPVFAILSNPPYVTEEEYLTLEPELSFEPKMALVGGADGLDFYRRIIPNCKDRLKKGGFIAFEIGYRQANALAALAEKNGMTAEIHRDLSGNDRLAVLRNK